MMVAGTHIRKPAVAGQFYDADPERCAAAVRRMCVPAAGPSLGVLVGAIVPHAGWPCSGRVAGLTLATLARHSDARTFVLTGSVHWTHLQDPTCDDADAWETPLGTVPVDVALRDAIAGLGGFDRRDAPHAPEHSLEVQLPLLQLAVGPELRIVPCLVPPCPLAPGWGHALGALLDAWPEPVAVIASSDLTHYGTRYAFTPHGADAWGNEWAHSTNDRELLEQVGRLDAHAALDHALERGSACGGGAIALTIEACRGIGARRAVLLAHTDSRRELNEPGATASVGYAGVVFGT
jgi:AmmeMemoRadiSam system protein B